MTNLTIYLQKLSIFLAFVSSGALRDEDETVNPASVFDQLWAPYSQSRPFSDVFGTPMSAPRYTAALRVVVVGAGSAGLAAALEASMAGANVTIFESRTTNYVRNNVLGVDPMTMDKFRNLGLPRKLFAQLDDLPEYANETQWAADCLTEDGKGQFEKNGVKQLSQKHVKCSEEGEGVIDEWGWGYLRTRCLEHALLALVKAKGITLHEGTQFVGLAVNEATQQRFAVLRSTPQGSFLGPSGTEGLFPADVFVVATGPGIRNQEKSEFRKWFVLPRNCTSGGGCPDWLTAVVSSHSEMRQRMWKSSTFDALDMRIVHKGIRSDYQLLRAAEGLPGTAEATQTGAAAWLVGLQDDNCKNWCGKRPQGVDSALKTLNNNDLLWLHKHNSTLLEDDLELANRFSFGFDLHVNQKMSYAMTAIFAPLKERSKRWRQVHMGAAWNSSSSTSIFNPQGKFRGANWLGNPENKDMQQVRIYWNKCAVYTGVGLSHETAMEMISAEGADTHLEDRVAACVGASTEIKGCDSMAQHEAMKVCEATMSYADVDPLNVYDAKRKQEGELKQLEFLQRLARNVGITGAVLPSDLPGHPTHTFFPISLHTLDAGTSNKDPYMRRLFVIGDASHAPNFLSGCGAIGGQDDSSILSQVIKAWGSGTTGRAAGTCANAKMKILQGLVYEQSCIFSDCNTTNSQVKQFVSDRLGSGFQLLIEAVHKDRSKSMEYLTTSCHEFFLGQPAHEKNEGCATQRWTSTLMFLLMACLAKL